MKEILDEHLVEQDSKNAKINRWFNLGFVLLILGSIAATVIAWFEIESIIFSGPIMSLVGILFSLLAKKQKDQLSIALGLVPLVTSILWVLAINLFSLKPNDCRFIVPVSLSVVLAVILLLSLLILLRKKREGKEDSL